MNWKAKAGAVSEAPGKINRRIRRAMRAAGRMAAVFLAAFLTGCASAELYTLREQAVEAYQQGNYQQAEELFNEALSFGGGEVGETELDILRYRADCELRCREFEKAEATYGILAQLDGSEDNRAAYAELQQQFQKLEELSRVRDLMQAGDYGEAYEASDRLAGLGGDAVAAAAWYNKAVCAEYMGRWEEAAELFGDFTAIYPEDQEAAKEYEFCRTRQVQADELSGQG